MKKIIYLLAIATFTLSSCGGSDPIHEPKLIITIDWTNCVEIPANYTAQVGDKRAVLSGTTNEYPHLLAPGSYTLYVYNTTDKISVSGTTATVTTTAGVVEPMPAWFFSGKAAATIKADKSQNITVAMKQEVCQLNITFTITEGDPDRISSFTGTLTGVAGAWNFDTNTPVGDAASVKPAFTRSGDKITTTMRLLGITGAEQKLTLNITFTDGKTQTIEKEVNTLLSGFNTEKHKPMTLTADLETPIGVGDITAAINNWASVGRSGTAN